MYTVEYSKATRKALRRLPRNLANRLLDKIDAIALDPYAQHNNVTAVIGTPYHRLRVGDWRVIYEIQDNQLIILVLKIKPRGGAYR